MTDQPTPEPSDPTQCSGEEGFCPEHGFHRHSLKQPGPDGEATPSRRSGLRNEIAKTIHRYDNEHGLSGNDIPSRHHRGEADAVLAVLYREWPWLRAEAEDTTPPQDGPHAPQDGPEQPDAGAETQDGAGGRQAGAEPLDRLRRLRDQLAAEHAKAVRADQQPRPDLDHLRVTAPNGMAVRLDVAIFFADHHLREAGEADRATPDNSATSGDAADNSLRERLRAAVRQFIDPDDDCMPALSDDGVGFTWVTADSVLDELMTALDQHLDIGEEQAWCKTCRRVWGGPRHRCESDGERQAAELREAFRQALDAFEAYWARASYCGPGEHDVQPEHLQAWRNTLDGKEQQ